jgi:hypothetical protein
MMHDSNISSIQAKFRLLADCPPMPFKGFKQSMLSDKPGVYVISAVCDDVEEVFYVGRARNLAKRVYQHLMGGLTASALKKYMLASKKLETLAEAKCFILEHCQFRYLILVGDSDADGVRQRGMLEGYAMGTLQPKYGIYREH